MEGVGLLVGTAQGLLRNPGRVGLCRGVADFVPIAPTIK